MDILNNEKIEISIVATLYNSSKFIDEFIDRIINAIKIINCSYEIILVDDGSIDDSSFLVEKHTAINKNIKLVKFSKNFDEFYEKIKSYEKTLRYGYYQVSEHCGKSYDYFRYGKYGDIEVEPTKKEFAEHVMKNCHPPYRSVMFAMWDGKPYDKLIWNIIKPEFKKL